MAESGAPKAAVEAPVAIASDAYTSPAPQPPPPPAEARKLATAQPPASSSTAPTTVVGYMTNAVGMLKSAVMGQPASGDATAHIRATSLPTETDARNASTTMEAIRVAMVHLGRAQVACGVLMVFLSWSWVVAGLSIASGAIILTHLSTEERASSYFQNVRTQGHYGAYGGCGCELVHLRPINIANLVVGAISLLSFIIACATLASWYIAAADAVSNNSVYSTYYSTGGVASSLRFQAAMLVFGVLFSLAQIALSAVVVQKQGQLEQAAAVVFPYVPRNRAAMMMMQQPPVIMVVQGGNQGVAMPQQGQGQYYAQYQQPQQQMQMQQMQVQASYAQQPIPTATVMQPGQVAVVENGKVEVAAEVTGVAVPAQTTKSVDV